MSKIDILIHELTLFNRVEWVDEQMDKMTYEELEHHRDVMQLAADSLEGVEEEIERELKTKPLLPDMLP